LHASPWIFFDEDNIYISARNWESHPERRVANEMRRDTAQLRQNDTFGVLLDTFHDKRNGYIFYANAIGGLADSQVTDEGPPNADWNTVWDVRTSTFEGGWTKAVRAKTSAIARSSIRDRSPPGWRAPA
jgi:hypothetical protein